MSASIRKKQIIIIRVRLMKRNKPQYVDETIKMVEQIGTTEFEGVFKVCTKILMVFEVLLVCKLFIKYKQITGIHTLYLLAI